LFRCATAFAHFDDSQVSAVIPSRRIGIQCDFSKALYGSVILFQ
jgi:hypothetical protein